jgi:hypothetical protein
MIFFLTGLGEKCKRLTGLTRSALKIWASERRCIGRSHLGKGFTIGFLEAWGSGNGQGPIK